MKFLPQGKKFFELFNEQANHLIKASEILKNLIQNFENLEEYSKQFSDLEHEADNTTHRIIEMLNRTFITPIDREDIHSLAHQLDDIIDLIHEGLHYTILYKIEKPTFHFEKMVDVLIMSLSHVAEAIKSLKDFKHPKKLMNFCIEINRLENEGDAILRKAMEELINNREDYFELIRWKEIYNSLEQAIDKCEDVANTIEGIVIKNS
ncbi:DUF47 family protein [Candidatus Aminicenantes bacterium AC-335-A11]|jgi:hypothetical protein|nr:DUF47 family protein [SCandidatus Aminicenantes bacterium Aminicenantia_JdfR_composite]MCP2596624.1 DUF47 family protein [Candidatus Aminicenantes bacterium AC-335-G13]MCP2598050.1 DUF47 family protein [Candidatus Aminicenantes bacterium AC-335-L06]MCP2618366.1 DUF47 family protein [Candidatus Aminicenantes bacterium AC-335-A11]